MSLTETPLYAWKFTWEGGEVETVQGIEMVLPGTYGSRITVYDLVDGRRVAVKSAKSDSVLDVALVEGDEQDDDGPTVIGIGVALPDALRHLFDVTKCNDPECPRCAPADEADDDEGPQAAAADVSAESDPEPEVSQDAATPRPVNHPYGVPPQSDPYPFRR